MRITESDSNVNNEQFPDILIATSQQRYESNNSSELSHSSLSTPSPSFTQNQEVLDYFLTE